MNFLFSVLFEFQDIQRNLVCEFNLSISSLPTQVVVTHIVLRILTWGLEPTDFDIGIKRRPHLLDPTRCEMEASIHDTAL